MIEALLAIIDRLLSLASYRDQRMRTLYREILEPAFNDLLLIHSDYLEMFDQVGELLSWKHLHWVGEPYSLVADKPTYGVFRIEPATLERLVEAAEYVRTKRLEFEPVRVKLRSVTSALGACDFSAPVNGFIKALINYFPQGELTGRTTRSGEILSLLDVAIAKAQEGRDISEQEIGDMVARVSDNLIDRMNEQRLRWSLVCEEFSRLKLSIMSTVPR